jgi:hypothetical protein
VTSRAPGNVQRTRDALVLVQSVSLIALTALSHLTADHTLLTVGHELATRDTTATRHHIPNNTTLARVAVGRIAGRAVLNSLLTRLALAVHKDVVLRTLSALVVTVKIAHRAVGHHQRTSLARPATVQHVIGTAHVAQVITLGIARQALSAKSTALHTRVTAQHSIHATLVTDTVV